MGETAAFLHALRFMTILPVADSESLEPDWLVRASRYFPAVGIVVGAVSALTLVVASHFWSGFVPAILAVAASALLTGALHEDGLADTADGFGGGRTRDSRLAIMKDSRIGTYGALALGLTLLLRIGALALLAPWSAAAALLATHAGARAATTLAMNALPYAGDTSTTRITYSDAALDRSGLLIVLLVTFAAMLPILVKSPSAWFSGAVLASACAFAMVAPARRLIGGYTGDVLGAIEQMFEVGFLLGAAAAR
jgi:adenosylcobinamide-GDP ribazoletransferase